MNRKYMCTIKSIFSIAWANFDTWVHSSRTIIAIMFVFSECIMLMTGLNRMLETYYNGIQMHLIEMMTLRMSEGCNYAIMSVLLLVTINEIPRKIGFQNYAMIRSNKVRWLFSQIVYCALMVIFMIILITIFMFICAIPYASEGNGWSDLERIMSGEINWNQTIINQYLIKNFSPISALLFCMIPLALFWFTMLLVILAFGLFGNSYLGIIVYDFMLVAHIIFLADGVAGIKFPSEFASYINIVGYQTGIEAERLSGAFAVYAFAILSILAVMYWRVQKMEFNFYVENKY